MPQPPTTGGGLMSFPSTVDTGGVVPQMLTPDAGDAANFGTGALTAGVAYFSAVSVFSPVTVIKMRCQLSGAPTGNIDMGIFDSTGTNGGPGNMLAHTGAILSATGVFTQNLTANLALSPGLYWLAWLDTVADTVFRVAATNIGGNPSVRSSATNLTVLASSIAVVNTGNRVAVVGMLSGGYT